MTETEKERDRLRTFPNPPKSLRSIKKELDDAGYKRIDPRVGDTFHRRGETIKLVGLRFEPTGDRAFDIEKTVDRVPKVVRRFEQRQLEPWVFKWVADYWTSFSLIPSKKRYKLLRFVQAMDQDEYEKLREAAQVTLTLQKRKDRHSSGAKAVERALVTALREGGII